MFNSYVKLADDDGEDRYERREKFVYWMEVVVVGGLVGNLGVKARLNGREIFLHSMTLIGRKVVSYSHANRTYSHSRFQIPSRPLASLSFFPCDVQAMYR